MKTKNRIQRFLSFFLGIIFTTTGIEKLTGLPDIIGPHYLIDELTKYDLGLYGSFIAYAQLCIGFMLLTNRLRTLGAVMLLPVLGNILMVTISLNWDGTPYVVSFLILLNLIVLTLDYHKIKFIFSNSDQPELKTIKPSRNNKIRDLYYLIPLAIILIGTTYGWSDQGKIIAKIGVWTTLISMLVINVLGIVKKRKQRLKT